ncbi:MAG: hypothetical protein GF309_08600 [Candidatus Lokiarchaeota archaeon]|nr:hypothetical protein [Candidatus Lokiarchaeota archaeon]
MPTSHFDQLNEIIELIVLTQPRRLLDIGVGFGKYGFLAREYLEFHGEGQTKEYNRWQRRIEGIEIFKDYLTPVHQFIYDEIYIGNAIRILPQLGDDYDLVLLIDVLEHFDSETGQCLVDECDRHCRNLLISTPKRPAMQGAVFGNPNERHQSQWNKQDFARFKDKLIVRNRHSWIFYIGADSGRIADALRWKTWGPIHSRLSAVLSLFCPPALKLWRKLQQHRRRTSNSKNSLR